MIKKQIKVTWESQRVPLVVYNETFISWSARTEGSIKAMSSSQEWQSFRGWIRSQANVFHCDQSFIMKNRDGDI